MDGIASFYLYSILLSNEETSIIIIFVQVNYLYYNMLSKMPPGGGIPLRKAITQNRSERSPLPLAQREDERTDTLEIINAYRFRDIVSVRSIPVGISSKTGNGACAT